MRMVRMYTGRDGRTQFEEVDSGLATPSEGANRSTALVTYLPAVTGQPMYRISSATDPEFHNAPRRYLVTILEGSIELVSTSGAYVTLHAGDVFQAGDLDGEGHIVRFAPGTKRYVFLFLTLAD